ncbi:hypothetical protein [Paraburkholderia sp. J69-1]|nr:hypothetical protein [Paraburkholderia sp. J69-1]
MAARWLDARQRRDLPSARRRANVQRIRRRAAAWVSNIKSDISGEISSEH